MNFSVIYSRLNLSLNLFTLICCFIIVMPLNATNWYVPSQAPTIQAGIDSASTGDTIIVSYGTYYEHSISMKAGIVLCSETGLPDCVTIDAEQAGRVMNCPGDAVINGFTLTGGVAGDGAGIYCNSNSTISNCIFLADTASSWGGGLYINTGKSPEIINCTFTDNYAGSLGGGVSYHTNCNPSFIHCCFFNNSAQEYGGAYGNWMGGYPVIEYCTFVGNISYDQGGAMFCWFANPNISYCTFYGNSAPSGAGIYTFNSSTSVNNSIISFSTSGAAVFVGAGGAPYFSCSDIYGNTGGDWIDVIAEQDTMRNNLSDNPLFVDAENGNFLLYPNSPCLSNVCGQIGAYGVTKIYPIIMSISDIDNDNGRQVRIRWTKSMYDSPDNLIQISEYEIYREQNLSLNSNKTFDNSEQLPSLKKTVLNKWDYIMSVPAHGDSIYQVVVPTLCDSTLIDGVCWSKFFVRATTSDRFVYFDSQSDSGYSIDNLFPATPEGLTANVKDSTILLMWQRVPDPDFNYYAIYRSTQTGFNPASMQHYSTTIDTVFIDNDIVLDTEYFYRVSAIDFSGNESACSNEVYATVTDIKKVNKNLPEEFCLEQNFPNPFNNTTKIKFGIPETKYVQICVFNLNGQKITTLINNKIQAGYHEITYSGENLSSGIYFYQIKAGSFIQVRKMILIK